MQNVTPTTNYIFDLISQEEERTEQDICLIASENYAPVNVLKASASVLTNKYAEGYPGKRYYAGCSIVDKIEQYAIDRARDLFGAEHVNVQPHAGSQANLAAYFAVLKPGDTLIGMNLAAGGHLTHGHAVNFSGNLYNCISYGLDPETQLIDYQKIEELAQTHKPRLIVVGASAYSRIIDFERCAAIAKKTGALLMADIAHIAGLIAADQHPSPIPHADIVTTTTHKTLRGPRGGMIMCKKELANAIDRAIMPGTQGGPFMHVIAAKAIAFDNALKPEFTTYQKQVIRNSKALAQAFLNKGYKLVSGGTDNHLFILDVRSKNRTGLEAQKTLEHIGIIVSRSCIPDDTNPWVTSGIRLGTPAVTTRGMQETEMIAIADVIDQALTSAEPGRDLTHLESVTRKLAARFPVYKTA